MYQRLEEMEEKGDTTRKTERISTRTARDGFLPLRSRVVQADGALPRYLKFASLFRTTRLEVWVAFCTTAENVANGEGEMQLRADGAGM